MYYCGIFSLNDDISNNSLGTLTKRPVPYIQKIQKYDNTTRKKNKILEKICFLIFFQNLQYLCQNFRNKKYRKFSSHNQNHQNF